MKSIAIEWEYMDGSGSHAEVDSQEDADALVRWLQRSDYAVRIWEDGEITQRGFIASDDRGER